MSSFLLDLPVEIRLEIYSYCVPLESPLGFPTKEWLGLLNSCKAIKTELEPEICRGISASLKGILFKIRNHGDEIIFDPPKTVTGWLDLTVSRPKVKDMFNKDDPFLMFKYFYFRTLTINFHNDDLGYEYYKERPHTYQSAASNLAKEIGKWYRWEAYPATERWILDWCAHPQVKQGRMDHGLLAYQRDAWEMQNWFNEQGLLTGVCFSRKPSIMTKKGWLEEREKERREVEIKVTRKQAREWEWTDRAFL